ncbi:MAG: CxxC-x17-CxxC domain-containing protein [Patescibacteria group bacterium]|jgi:CxxC-x17-CxxC domain-containing protein
MPYQKKGPGGFKRAGKSFGDRKPSFGGPKVWDHGNRSGGFDRPAMFDATCSECHNACQVPFKPTGRRPVLCNNCFRKDGGGSDRPSFGEKRDFAPREERFGGATKDQSRDLLQLKEQMRTVNEKLDTILAILDDKE